MKERKIQKRLLESAFRAPTDVLPDRKGKFLIKKVYRKSGKARLLLIVGEVNDRELRIITVIETSKVKKYL